MCQTGQTTNQAGQPRRLTFFTRPNCPLCDAAWFVVQRVTRGMRVEIEKVDISAPGQESWQVRFDEHIPVVFIDGREHCRHRVDESRLRRALTGDD